MADDRKGKPMQNQNSTASNKELEVGAFNGWLMLAINLALLFLGVYFIANTIYEASAHRAAISVAKFLAGIGLEILAVILLIGHFTLQPNQARVLILFGAYRGTVRRSGFHWANPFYSRRTKISLRAHNFNSDKLKVNDKRGNPIEIAAVVVWRVADTAQAMFDHLAYAPEIAQAMLRRQQAEAVIAARQKIVHGAVSMVDMALKELAEKGVVKLDEERKAAMVSNLLVVLCGEAEVSPVVNTGTLYT